MENKKALALYFTAPEKVEIREEELNPEEGGIFIESRLIGISHGTEMVFFRGELSQGIEADLSISSLPGKLDYPIKYGYINTGITESGRRIFAFYPHQDKFYINREDLIDVPPDMKFEDAVFLASMETALNIVLDAAPRFGENILIIGQGVVGLLVSEILKLSHMGNIITLEPFEKRRKSSARIGCISLSPFDKKVEKKIGDLTDGRGVDIAINLSSTESGLQFAIDTLAFQGTVVEASWFGAKSVSLSLGSNFHRKRVTIKSSQVSTIDQSIAGRWDKKRRLNLTLDLLKKIKPAKYITHRIKLADAQKAFEILKSNPEETIQIVLEP